MPKTLLIVAEELNILKALKRDLKAEEYRIITALDGSEALRLLSSSEVQVVISDQRMPSLEFVHEVRRLYPETVHIIISAFNDFDVIKEALNEGDIYKIINKPWDAAVLRKYVLDAFRLNAEKREVEQLLENALYYDALTGLYDRFRFLQELAAAVERADSRHYKLMLIFIDIDHFSEINNILGREAGDQVLRQTAHRLGELEEQSAITARLGSDGFCILIENPETSPDAILNQLFTRIKRPLSIGARELEITVSAGLSVYPDISKTDELLMRHADLALQQSKKDGGDQYQIFEKSVSPVVEDVLSLRSDLRTALGENQFVLYYQPIIAASNGRIVNAEALLRWQHPRHGLLVPNAFLRICEESGLIIEIGKWALRAACRQLLEWDNQGHADVGISINLSTRQFIDPVGLFSMIMEVIDAEKFDASRLTLEITENLLTKNLQEIIHLMQSLNKLGIKFALDDFGTGYSSLSYLRQLPFSNLKIDRSFIQDIQEHNESLGIVSAIISLAKACGLTTIAEGVETPEQYRLLKNMGCDLMQGYLLGKPVPAHELINLLIKA